MQVRIKAKASQDWASRFQDRSRSFLTDRTRRRRTRLLAAADPMTAFFCSCWRIRKFRSANPSATSQIERRTWKKHTRFGKLHTLMMVNLYSPSSNSIDPSFDSGLLKIKTAVVFAAFFSTWKKSKDPKLWIIIAEIGQNGQNSWASHNSSFGTEQGLLRLLRTQPHRKYQSHVHNSLLRTHQFVLVPKLPLRDCWQRFKHVKHSHGASANSPNRASCGLSTTSHCHAYHLINHR